MNFKSKFIITYLRNAPKGGEIVISDSEKLIAIYRVVLKLERKGLISKLVMGDLLYLVPIAVKDYEVTRLLHDKR